MKFPLKSWLRENRNFLLLIVGFLFFRTAIADWNPVPSGSMRPTILEGDVVFVERIAYDWKLPLTDVSVRRVGEPRRGDVVTFGSPRDGTRLIKRVVGVPGDTVELRADRLTINGQPATYAPVEEVAEPVAPGIEVRGVREVEQWGGQRRVVQFLPDVRARRDFGPVVIPPDEFFMMGDNRDNSEDSRFIGLVPRRLIIGQAHRVLVSADITSHWAPRWDRFAAPLR
ncbi:signal peptidase I [Roseateles aquatilis]|uniref:Signal peptidase I n=1 Tax=Roseateles aquatilis TaxID=431061 RepID=A0A246JED2_9BURK|nr:signal peptidase I [Roseateles aquatilis]OWQ90847.1 signal peptidase I [Roseateles aquatilis]